ncbi:MAG: hypothetical protein CMJ48_08010, partial [Planctomycetaceae bacterium]|nr:hypothetical protein [Planctomycetaceae bacterium]
RPRSRGTFANFGFETRTVRGRVVDHEGKPVVGALVAFAERIGYSGECFDENFDKTDEMGRFLVEGDLERTRVVVRRSATAIWNVNLKPEQEFVAITWPKPATCHITVDPSLCNPNDDLTITTTRYCAGMSVIRVKARIDADRRATVANLIPGDYFIAANKSITIGDADETTPVEIGHFSIEPGEEKRVSCVQGGQRRVVGKIPKAGVRMRLRVERQKLRYEDWTRCVGFVACAEDGSFRTRPLEPGRYLLRFVGPAPANRGGFRGFGFPAGPVTVKHRLDIPNDDVPIELTVGGKQQGTSAFVHQTLDREASGLWSNADIQISELLAHPDRKGVSEELLRITNDPLAPYSWRRPALRALGGMTDSPKVIDALLEKLKSVPRSDTKAKARVIRAFAGCKHSSRKIVESIAEYRNDENLRVRWATYDTLARLVHVDPDNRERIIGWLVEMLSDPWDRIRADVAATLGRLAANQSVPALRKARNDPVGKVRVWSAWAIARITHERRQAVELMTERLLGVSLAGK